ncbi:coxsackievirus and adenovirus receptor homolog [Centropristis striata]|uniref:coxsackievirus and adenovirus receptor homolog n=1 Tax=Centropristis striata TaxID=184440 RepID=UPI0027E110E9|nr:coxsackievirus and adenovirus receptor homolog [Centropristis striata]XP_059210951.1 coxsackievirus and adenovirus receptor homolog [Centropristis striata]
MSLCAVFCPLLLCLPAAAAVLEQLEIRAKPGGDVVLPCQAGLGGAITLLEWRRPDLKAREYVFFYREERAYPNYQLPSVRGRVEPREPGMKNGDVSVVLKDVSVNDTGTYECRVTVSFTEHNKTIRSEVRNLIHLTVTHSGQTTGNEHGNLGLVVGASVAGVFLLLLGVISCIVYRLKKKSSYKPPADASVVPVT